MLNPLFVAWMFSIVIVVLGADRVSSQDYPNRPINIVSSGISSTASVAARLIALEISGPLGQPVIIINRGGVWEDSVARAPADGYTLMANGSGFWLVPLTRKMPYDPVKEFAPISMLGTTPFVLFSHPSLPVKSVKELIALAKARPGELNSSIGGIGAGGHLTAELFKSMAGVNIVIVPYANDQHEIADLISGRMQLTFTASATMRAHAKSGKMRALAVIGAQPSAMLPGVPTMEVALPGFEAVQRVFMFAPANTPGAIINRLNQEIVRVLNRTDIKQKLLDGGLEAGGSTPQELGATLKSEMAKWAKVIKDAGIKTE